MKETLSIVGAVAALAILSPFLVPLVLGVVAARSLNRREAQKARHWSRAIRIHHGGKCTCEMCDEIRHNEMRKAVGHE